jgi:hypothetical protein
MGLDDYVLARLDELMGEANSQDRVKLIVEGLVATSFKSLALGEDDRAQALNNLAQKLLERYKEKTEGTGNRIPIPPLSEIKRTMLKVMLDPDTGLPDDLAERLRTVLNLPAGTNSVTATAAEQSINAAVREQKVTTNALWNLSSPTNKP